MLRKTTIAALGFLGLFLAGTAAGTAPASAGYACGPWNNFCRPVCGPWNGWCAGYLLYPGWGWGGDWDGGYGGHRNWSNSNGHNNWHGNWNNGNGHNDHHDQAYKHNYGKHYD